MVAAMTLGFSSCSNDEQGLPPINPETTVDKIVESLPKINIEPSTATGTLNVAGIGKLTLEKNGIYYFIPEAVTESRATGNANIVTGRYTVADDGTITCEVEGIGTFTIPGDRADEILLNGEKCDAEPLLPGSRGEESLCRTWYPKNYRAAIYSLNQDDQPATCFAQFEATTLEKLQQDIEKECSTESKPVKVNLLDGEISKFNFICDGTVISTYKDKDEVGEWEWTSEEDGTFVTTFSDKVKDIACIVRYESASEGQPAKAYLISDFIINFTGKGGEPAKAMARAIIELSDKQ